MPRAQLRLDARGAAAIAGGLVFLTLAATFWANPYPFSVDVAADDAFQTWAPEARYEWGDSAGEVGFDYAFLALADGVLLVAAWRLAQPLLAAGLGFSLVTQEVLVRVTKGVVAKVRPEGAYAETGAFPSGHVANVALTVLLFLWVVFPLALRRPPSPRDGAIAALLAVAYAGFRVASGEHWVTDVVGSLGLATAWAVLTARAVAPWAKPGRERRP